MFYTHHLIVAAMDIILNNYFQNIILKDYSKISYQYSQTLERFAAHCTLEVTTVNTQTFIPEISALMCDNTDLSKLARLLRFHGEFTYRCKK